MLAEEDYLTETSTIQIFSCHRSASTCFRERDILKKFCEAKHLLSLNTYVKIESDYYTRIRTSIENIPVKLPDMDKTLLSDHTTVIGKTYIPVIKHNNKYFTTETRIYLCIKLLQDIPKHIYKFRRSLRIRYDSQLITNPGIQDNNIPNREDSPIPKTHASPIITNNEEETYQIRHKMLQSKKKSNQQQPRTQFSKKHQNYKNQTNQINLPQTFHNASINPQLTPKIKLQNQSSLKNSHNLIIPLQNINMNIHNHNADIEH